MIRYLIWDAGGTLFDTYPAVAEACRVALGQFGEAAPSEWVINLCKQTTAHGLRTLAQTFQLDEDVLKAHFRRSYDDIGAQFQPPFPGVEQVCRYICDIGGQNFIVTHRERASLQILLEAHRMAAYFSDYVTGEDPFPRKPDPASIEALIARHHLERAECMVVGDRDLDIQAGRNAGLRTCFFGAESHITPADVEILSYAELMQWLTAINQS